jgi:hypothetical protein
LSNCAPDSASASCNYRKLAIEAKCV